MKDINAFRNQIIKYGGIAGLLICIIYLLFFGIRFPFLIGAAAGTAISALGFVMIVFTGKKVSEEGRRAPAVLSYIVRLPIYGIVFYLCIRFSLVCGIGCVLGFITIPLSIFYIYGIKSRFPGARKNPLNDSDEPREWRNLDEDGWDDDDDWGAAAAKGGDNHEMPEESQERKRGR